MTRRVVLICGPPGSGKTTYAQASGLEVYDRDDPWWYDDERRFKRALAKLRSYPDAQAAVIRAGATASARDATAHLIGATEVVILKVSAEICQQRIKKRARTNPPIRMQLAAAVTWWENFDQPSSTPTSNVRSREW